MAVCQLYMGKLKESLTTLETLVHSNPDKFVQVRIARIHANTHTHILPQPIDFYR